MSFQFTLFENKKGIELSVNFLVSLIIAIVLFGMGVIFARNLFSGSTNIMDTSQESLNAMIESMYCTNNELVCVNMNAKTLKRGADQVFGVNVINVLAEADFHLAIQATKYIATDGTVTLIDASFPEEQKLTIFPNDAEFFLPQNKEERIGFLIRPEPSTLKGKFIIDVTVERAGQTYDTTHKIYVTVI